MSDLRTIQIPKTELDLLAKCLRRWSGTRTKGIPQGYTASDILAKVYLGPVDQALRNEDLDHLRYVDDFRVFCGSRNEAKQAILVLAELMSNRGLNLQSAKTDIYTKEQAKPQIGGVAEKLEDVTQQLHKEINVDAAEGS